MANNEQEEFEFRARAEKESQKSQGGSFLGVNKRNLPQTISSAARPILEIGGAVGGSLLGGGIDPVTGALGFATGKAGSDLLDRMIGTKKPLQNIGQAAMETGQDIVQGGVNEATGLVGGKALSALKKPIASAAGNLGRIASGVKPEIGKRLFNDPGAFLSPSLEKAGEKIGTVRSKLGILSSKPYNIEEVVDSEAGTARRTAKEMFEKLQTKKASTTDLVKGSQSVDDIIEATPIRQRNKRRMLFDLKRQFTDALHDAVPEERAAAKEYSRSALASEFRKFFPVTKSGDVSVLRSLGTGLLEGGGKLGSLLPTNIAQSPFLSGAGIAGGGQAYKMLQNPQVVRMLLAAIRSQSQNENPNP